MGRPVHLFHYHLVTSKVRLLEGRYLGKLGFELIGRYGWRGESSQWFEPGTSWEELDAMGFRLRLVELGRGAVNVVLQPGHWDVPRVDHLGIALDEEEYEGVVDRAAELEVHPPRDWIEDALSQADDLRLSEIHLRASDPEEKAVALAEILDIDRSSSEVAVGDSLVRFLPGGPEGRPELVAEVMA